MDPASARRPLVAVYPDEALLRRTTRYLPYTLQRERRLGGMAASIALHLLIALLLLYPLRQDFARVLTAGTPLAGEGRAGGGGGGAGGRAYISLPAPPRSAPKAVEVQAPPSTQPARVTPPVPADVVPPPIVQESLPVEAPVAAAAAAPTDSAAGQGGIGPGAGGGAGGGTGGGFGPGTGTGVGPGTGTGKGEAGATRPPMLRHQVIPPENPPKELRGVDLTVTFWVTEAGSVAKVEVSPPIKDRKFAGKFEESMMQYRFRPGLGPDGKPVASIATHTVTY